MQLSKVEPLYQPQALTRVDYENYLMASERLVEMESNFAEQTSACLETARQLLTTCRNYGTEIKESFNQSGGTGFRIDTWDAIRDPLRARLNREDICDNMETVKNLYSAWVDCIKAYGLVDSNTTVASGRTGLGFHDLALPEEWKRAERIRTSLEKSLNATLDQLKKLLNDYRFLYEKKYSLENKKRQLSLPVLLRSNLKAAISTALQGIGKNDPGFYGSLRSFIREKIVPSDLSLINLIEIQTVIESFQQSDKAAYDRGAKYLPLLYRIIEAHNRNCASLQTQDCQSERLEQLFERQPAEARSENSVHSQRQANAHPYWSFLLKYGDFALMGTGSALILLGLVLGGVYVTPLALVGGGCLLAGAIGILRYGVFRLCGDTQRLARDPEIERSPYSQPR